MAIALILVAALAWWLHKRGELLPNLARWAGAGVAALVAVKLGEGGRLIPAAIAAAAGWWWWQKGHRSAIRPDPEAGALALLGLPPGAGAESIQAAWRSRMAFAHPDVGGSVEAAQKLTEARDLLLARRAAQR